jgi:LuxR family maltose regulon positive regulatory protein
MYNWMTGLRDLFRRGGHAEAAPKVARQRTRASRVRGEQREVRTQGPQRPQGSRVRRVVGASARTNGSAGVSLQASSTLTPIGPEPMLRLTLFGPLRAYIGGQLVIDEHFTRRKAKALLVLLYLERGRYLARDELLEALWPNLDEPPGDAGRLKQAALVLRRALEGQSSRQTGWRYIVERDGSYYFNMQAPYRSDLEDFEEELRQAYCDRQHGDIESALDHFRQAFTLHRSDLLPEFRYDLWAASEITRVREQYLQALEDAARLHSERAEYARAIELLRRDTREDPLRESSTSQLMEALWRNGDHAEALRVYARLQNVLASELQLEPDPQITELYHAIRRDRGAEHEGPGLSAAS